MAGLDVDFKRIRAHRGDQRGGFEELCCQLAGLEDTAADSHFMRKGPGADQGLECYRTYADGHEVGWQAKYFINEFDAGQVADLKDSLTRALAAHPQLRTFIVCLPIDLQDNRAGKKLSQNQRYEKWRKESINAAAAAGRTLDIQLWSASSISERLGRDLPAYSGRARYWFDAVHFSSAWFRDMFEVPRHNLGERYSPESHVDLPIQRALQGLARDPGLLEQPGDWAAAITEKLDTAGRSVQRDGLENAAKNLRLACEPLLQALSSSAPALENDVPVARWAELAKAASDSVASALNQLEEKSGGKERYSTRRELYELHSAIDHVRRELNTSAWQLLNERALVVTGPAGIGKSHLVADFGARQLEQGRPSVLVLTGTLAQGDPWEQIRGQLDLSQVSTKDFLGALDAAAEAANCRAVLTVDALNEKQGISIWETRLQGFVATVKKFPRLAVVLTVRDTYVSYLPLEALKRIVHRGFAGHASTAARAYLDRRGIARPSSPNLAREFENPLFLRTCCEYLESENLKQFPKGLDGVTALFDFYLAGVAKRVDRALRLLPQAKVSRKALDAFLQASITQGDRGSLPLEETISLLDGFHNSGGTMDRSLLAAYLSEGVLTQEVEWHESGNREVVRFTFERLSDHLRAKHLLKLVDRAQLEGSFQREPLAPYFLAENAWEYAGVVEALAVQVPEEFGVELLDLLPEDALENEAVTGAFVSSLAWRTPKAFTERTAQWIEQVCERTDRSPYGLLLLVATEPDNGFNADWLHNHLWPRSMPERDATWSVFLARDDLSEGGAVESLIEWAWEVNPEEVDERRSWLSALTLTWCLSTSNRAVRDRATKSLVNLLSWNLAHASALVEKFAGVNDLYITERLLAACHGAVMQGLDPNGSKDVAHSVWKVHFAGANRPPVHLLARDYALGVLLHANAVGQLPADVELEFCKAKFTSAWPLEQVTEEELDKKYKGKGYGDSITSSCNEHGDFGNYTLKAWLHDITVMPRALAGQTVTQLFKQWEAAFQQVASSEQLQAYVNLAKASLEYRQRPRRLDWLDEKGRRDDERLMSDVSAANTAFKESLSTGLLAEYCSFAERHLLEATRMNDDNRRPSEVDHAAVRRWVCERAHNLGWAEALFNEFDRGSDVTRERMGNHRVERVGKKYQHIALAEATARLVDHLALCSYGDEGKLRAFEYGPTGRDMRRDIDPSLLVRGTKESRWATTPATWWTPSKPRLPVGSVDLLIAWLAVDSDLCNTAADIAVTSPDGQKWLVVDSFCRWSVDGQRKRPHADAWTRISCLVTRRGDGAKLAKELLRKHRGDATQLRDDRRLEAYLGEHGWRDSENLELTPNDRAGIKTRYTGIVDTLSAEGSTEDNSVDETFSLHLPSSGIMKVLDLHLRNGRRPEYVDASGALRWLDPSLRTRGAGAALVSRDYFLERLAAADLEPVWVIAGEKNVYPGQDLGARDGFGGCLDHTAVVTLDKGALKRVDQRLHHQPATLEQLEALRKQE